jgi:maltose-binding protein MalE
MRQRLRTLVGVVLLGMVVAACGGGAATTTTAAPTTTTAAPTTTTTEATTTTAEPIELLVWADEKRAPVVEEIAPAFTEETGVTVTVEIVGFGDIRGQVQTAGPAGEGPDIYIGAHDWTGELVANGVAEPIDLGGKAGDFNPTSLGAFTVDGQLYAVPVATEAIALYYNTDLVAEAPATFEEIAAICDGLSGIENCVGVPGGGDGGDAYHHFPFISALGGYIFKYDPASGFDPSDVGLDNDGAIAGIQFLEEQVAAGVIASTNYDTAKALFLDGKEPFWITGPWEVGGLQEQTTVNWAVAKIPTIGGNAPAPFVGAQGMFLSAFSENKVVALSFLLDFVATAETQQALYDADPRLPVFNSVAEALSGDPVVEAFLASVADGIPMPNIPEMGSVWGPVGDNLLLVRNGEISAGEAMTAAAAAVREAVGA